MSAWSRSHSKRAFDLTCALIAVPLLLPLFVVIALTVRCTSAGPVLFRQRRMGCNGNCFTILKFRTMLYKSAPHDYPLTTASHPSFTPIGPFLRRWKLDELPQLFNVIAGHMSLVGPRPRPPLHDPHLLRCRPGITGAATLAFALEETYLDRIPRDQLTSYYFAVVLPAKRDLDQAYMANANLRSDLGLIVRSLSGRWNDGLMKSVLRTKEQARIANLKRIGARNGSGSIEALCLVER